MAALALPLVAVTLLVSACGAEHGPSSAQARESVREAGDSMRSTLARPAFYDTLSAWKTGREELVPDPTCHSGDGGSRWRLVGAATVGDTKYPGRRDGDGAIAVLVGALPSSWDTNIYVGDLDDDPTLVEPATYGKGADAVQAEITIQRSGAGGFTYSLSARSACIEK